MNWLNVAGLAGGGLILLFSLLRVERRRLWVVVLLLVLPTVWLIVIWSNFYHRWAEALLGLAIAGAVAGGWWWVYGRHLPPPTSDNIKVWGQEEGPKPKPQEMQAEIQRLQVEKDRLEDEVRRLKGGNGHQEN